MAAKLEETLAYGGATWELGANRWQSGAVAPEGHRFIERFCLESGVPVWTYACADALLEKRVWMEQGANTTYVQYRLLRGFEPAALTVKALVNYRGYHGTTRADGWRMQVEAVSGGLVVTAFDGARPLRLLSDGARAEPAEEWYRGYDLRREAERGLDHVDDHLHAGTFHASVAPGASVTVVLSAEPSRRSTGSGLAASGPVRGGDARALGEGRSPSAAGAGVGAAAGAGGGPVHRSPAPAGLARRALGHRGLSLVRGLGARHDDLAPGLGAGNRPTRGGEARAGDLRALHRRRHAAEPLSRMARRSRNTTRPTPRSGTSRPSAPTTPRPRTMPWWPSSTLR